MDITYFGRSSFRIRGKQATVVTDPFDDPNIGIKFPKHIEANIVTISHTHKDHNAPELVEGSPYIVRGPGEYDIKGVGVVGHRVYHDAKKGEERGTNTVYRIDIDGVSVVHLGDLGHTLSSDEVEELDGVNILMIPVGGLHTIDAAQAVQVINDIEPSIVIPMHYGGQLAPVSAFLKEIGKEGVIAQPKLTISKDKLPAEMQVVILE
jgi:L-ascorbate metabolism protein UlaG (beta-lactamase superfamily)